jgi:hypothetical protein
MRSDGTLWHVIIDTTNDKVKPRVQLEIGSHSS